jgi:ESCRT-II complex subunit VPS36
LYRAALQLDSLGLSFRLRKYESGVKVLEPKTLTDEFIADGIIALLKDHDKGLSALQLAFLTKISIIVAQEHLLLVERMGLVCRDDSIESLQFYPNLFIS